MPAGDNLGVNPGTVAQVSADSINRGEGISFAQFVKLLSGADGSTNAILADADGAMYVKEIGVRSTGDTKRLLVDPLNNADAGVGMKAAVGASTMTGRKTLYVFNDSDVRIRYAFATPKTAVDRGVIPSGQGLYFMGALDVYLWAETGGAAGTKAVLVTEVA
jgi:predicted ABC-class ATPase